MRSRAAQALPAVAAALAALAGGAAEGAPAPSLEDPSVVEARGHFQRGVQLFHEASYDASLAEFRKAYQVAPSYRLLYNIAQVDQELHDYVGAFKSFRQYLGDGAEEIGPARRREVEAEIQKLQGRIAYLEIKADVEGADILVDDAPVGISPLEGPVLVNTGVRRVVASKAGRVSPVRNVTVAGGDLIKVALQVPGAGLAAAEAAERAGAPERERARLWLGVMATAGLGLATGAMAVATSRTQTSFESELAAFPSSKERIDHARSRMSTYAAITDGLLVAALAAGGVTAYLALTGRHRLGIGLGPGGITVAGRY
jgi:tetratricopeptide (TPR) repeat protein